jgi:hypothetical protein
MTTTPGRLHVDSAGRVRGAANIEYNQPFPTPSGEFGSGKISGVIMHTMVGNLPGTIAAFNDQTPPRKSAHFGIAQSGLIHQFGPIGKGWIAWAQAGGNDGWYSIEHADDGSTGNPLTESQIEASAQLLECLSAFADFPLRVTNSVDGTGYGTHVMGGIAWGGHTCPGPGPRAGQRDGIVALAKKIRTGGVTLDEHTTGGELSLADFAAAESTAPSTILRQTAIVTGVYQDDLADYVNGIMRGTTGADTPMPAGIKLYGNFPVSSAKKP